MKKKGAAEDTKEKVRGWRWVSWEGQIHEQAALSRSGVPGNQLPHATPHEGSGGADAAV